MILVRSILLIICFAGLILFAFKRTQNARLNWSIFYSLLFTSISLAIVNYICVKLDYWTFLDEPINGMLIPFDIYFIWIIFWGMLPILFVSKKYFPVIILILFWLDILLMPLLDTYGLIHLNHNWLIGEALLLIFVLIPSMYWAYISYHNKFTMIRATFQVLVMAGIFVVGLPFVLHNYSLIENFSLEWSSLEFQLLIIVVFPALIATRDLIVDGKGTPFPYDPTSELVRTGVYAYIRNPIQWSFTFMFIPLSIFHGSYYLLIGSVVSIAYAFAVSDFQEYPDMESRFKEKWKKYKQSVPKWYFQFRPKNYPKGKIYFNENCHPCSQLQSWFLKSKSTNLEVESSTRFPGVGILQLTYIDYKDSHFKSIDALSKALEHIHLGWACLAWFIRIPGIKHLLQAIVNSMDFDSVKKCETSKTEDS